MINQAPLTSPIGQSAALPPNAATGETAAPDLFAAMLSSLLPAPLPAAGIPGAPAVTAPAPTGVEAAPPGAPDALPVLDVPVALPPPKAPNAPRLSAFLSGLLQAGPVQPPEADDAAVTTAIAPPSMAKDMDPAVDAAPEPLVDQQVMAFWLAFQMARLPAAGSQPATSPVTPSHKVDGGASQLALLAGNAGTEQGINAPVAPSLTGLGGAMNPVQEGVAAVREAGSPISFAPSDLVGNEADANETPLPVTTERAGFDGNDDASKDLGRADAEALRPLLDTIASTVAEPAYGTETTASVARPAQAVPLAHLPVEIVHAFREGIDRLEVHLHPEDLGSVDVTVEVGQDQRAHIIIAAERPETLELLQRDLRQIERVLAAQGLRLDGGGIEMNLRQQGDRHAGGEGRPRGARRPLEGIADDSVMEPPAARRILLDRLYDIQA